MTELSNNYSVCVVEIVTKLDQATRLAQQLFANNLQHKEKVRLIGFRLGNLEMPISRQITLQL